MIVFNGLEDGVMREIVFLEIKTGEGAALSQKQRQIRDAIPRQEGRLARVPNLETPNETQDQRPRAEGSVTRSQRVDGKHSKGRSQAGSRFAASPSMRRHSS
jgi:hypothetical protein